MNLYEKAWECVRHTQGYIRRCVVAGTIDGRPVRGWRQYPNQGHADSYVGVYGTAAATSALALLEDPDDLDLIDSGVDTLTRMCRANGWSTGSYGDPDPEWAMVTPTCFALDALLDAPVAIDDRCIDQPIRHLLSIQWPAIGPIAMHGGWGEYRDGEPSVYATAHVLSTLSRCRDHPGVEAAIECGYRFLREHWKSGWGKAGSSGPRAAWTSLVLCTLRDIGINAREAIVRDSIECLLYGPHDDDMAIQHIQLPQGICKQMHFGIMLLPYLYEAFEYVSENGLCECGAALNAMLNRQQESGAWMVRPYEENPPLWAVKAVSRALRASRAKTQLKSLEWKVDRREFCDSLQWYQTDEARRRLSSYYQPPTYDDVAGWVRQFPTRESKYFAAHALTCVHSIAEEDVATLLNSGIENALSRAAGKDLVVAPFGEAGGSAAILAYCADHLQNNHIEVRPLVDVLSLGDPSSVYCVLVEDCVFSGNQSARILEDYCNVHEDKRYQVGLTPVQLDRFRALEGMIVFLVGRAKGVECVTQKVKELNTRLEVACMQFLETPKVFSEDHPIWTHCGLDRYREEMRGIFADIGYAILEGRAKERDWSYERHVASCLGFGDDQEMIVFPYNVPKSTISLFWENGGVYRGSTWTPIVPIREN